MARDCKKFSKKAQKIFNQLERFFTPDPWKKPQWKKCGEVHDNIWFDLRLSKHRDELENKQHQFIGHIIETQASIHMKLHRSLNTFVEQHYPKSILRNLHILLILKELDFQIETQDVVDEVLKGSR